MDHQNQLELAEKIAATLHDEFLYHETDGLDPPEILQLVEDVAAQLRKQEIISTCAPQLRFNAAIIRAKNALISAVNNLDIIQQEYLATNKKAA